MDIQPTTVEIKARLKWRFFRDDRSRRWIAICDPLKLTIEADTHTELRENIADGLNLFFGSMLKDDLLDEYLVQHGWSYGEDQEGIAPVMITGDGNTIMVAGAIAVEHLHLAPRGEADSRAK